MKTRYPLRDRILILIGHITLWACWLIASWLFARWLVDEPWTWAL